MKHSCRLPCAVKAALGTLAIAGVVHAQEPAPEETHGVAIDEVIVTAQRRVESVQKSSLTVQVLNEAQLAAMTQVRDLNEIVPGVQIAAGGNTPQTFIRGIGSFSSDANIQPAVGYNIDGVAVADQTSVTPLFFDLQRVEVLKGPQGTLYGRNSSAGAINILPHRPNTDALGGKLSAEIGNYDRAQASGAVNVPFSNVAAMRASFNYISRDGYLSDGGDDDDQKAGRLQFLFDDHEKLSTLLGADYALREGKGPGAVYAPHFPGRGDFSGITDISVADHNSTLIGPIGPLVMGPGSGFDFDGLNITSPRVVPDNNNTSVDNEQYGFFAEAKYDFGPLAATFIPAYRHSRNKIDTYTPYLPYREDLETEQKSYELRLSHDSSALNTVVGVYYLDFDQHDIYDTALHLARISRFENELSTKSSAVFGQATYTVVDGLRLTAGLRHTREKRSITGGAINRDATTGAVVPQAWEREKTFKNTSFRAGVEYDLTADNMLYATASKGFKSGGFNASSGGDPYDPETVMAYTLGAKNRFLDNSLQLNVEAFYWDIEDSQQTHFGFTSLGDICFCTGNAATAETYGAELEVMWRPTVTDRLRLQLAYLDATFGEFVYDIPSFLDLPGSTGCAITPAGALHSIDCSNRELPRAPRWSGNAGYEHSFALGGGALTLGVDASFASKRWLAVDYTPAEDADSFTRWNAAATYELPSGNTTVTAYVNNIGDDETAVGGLQPPFTPGIILTTVMAPRTYGLRVLFNF